MEGKNDWYEVEVSIYFVKEGEGSQFMGLCPRYGSGGGGILECWRNSSSKRIVQMAGQRITQMISLKVVWDEKRKEAAFCRTSK